jgi:hypothetical protein
MHMHDQHPHSPSPRPVFPPKIHPQSNHMADGAVRDTGVVLAYGEGPLAWDAPLACQLAAALADAGGWLCRP